MNRQTQTIRSEELDGDVNIIVYDPHNVGKDEPVAIVYYIFGDFLFHPFAGLLQYLSQELSLVPKTILVGINEIPGMQIGAHQKEYAHFITHQLTESLLTKHPLIQDGILYGHSRATRLVAEVMQNHSPYIGKFILSAPWFTDQQLSDLENSLRDGSHVESVFITQSEEDMGRSAVRDAHQKLLQMLSNHATSVRTEYRYLKRESHMSIPPLSFYYGVLWHLGRNP